VIIDFAVENNLDIPILVAHRLVAAHYVDDTQASMDETDPIPNKHSASIWPTVSDGMTHLSKDMFINSTTRSGRQSHSGDTAHCEPL
jgi:hypothetical protein